MKPKTKLHHQVLGLFKKRSKLSHTKIAWAEKRLFKRYYFETKKNLTCMECGHRWDKTQPVCGRYCQCPKCSLFLEKWKGKNRTARRAELFMVLECVDEFQVAQYYTVTRHVKVQEKARYTTTEVVNQWLSPKGKMLNFARLPGGFYSISGWSNSPIELRGQDAMYYNCAIYPKKYIHPHVYRNGYDGNNHNFHIMYISKILLAYPAAETLLKTGKWDLFKEFHKREVEYKKYWSSMLIAWRHKFDFESKMSDWFDHLVMLKYFKMDIHNPKFICPADFENEHIKLSRRRAKVMKEERDRLNRIADEEKLRRQKKLNRKFIKEYKRYFDLKITIDKHTEIVVLKDIDDFIEEGDALHHCVGGYFGHENSLIFSTQHKGKRIETIQFDLKDMEVKQARGACNKDSDYHHKAINHVMNNVQTIKKLKTA